MASVRLPVAVLIATVVVLAGRGIAQQSVLAQLGLTEATARTFLLDEVKAQGHSRTSAIAITGTRAFLKLPAAARGPAATALFAWAKSYVNSAAFKTAYANVRRDAGANLAAKQYDLTVDEAVKKQIDDALADLERAKQAAAAFPAAERAAMLAAWKEQEAYLRNPNTAKEFREAIETERAAEAGSESELVTSVNERYPADANKLFARRLHEFLDATADVSFAARTINLTGGLDGIELADPRDRGHHWMWDEAVIVGREATTAARTAATAWLREIER